MEGTNMMGSSRQETEASMVKREVALLQEDEEMKPMMMKDMKNAAGQSEDIEMKDEELLVLDTRVAKLNKCTSTTFFEPEKAKEAGDIVPEELWKAVFEKVSDPKDLWNLCNTCILFEDILHQWKTGWMLEQALPHLYKHLSGSKLLQCRIISKGWNGAVDSFLENHPSLRPHTDGGDSRRLDTVNPMLQLQICRNNYFTFYSDEGSNQFIMRSFPRVEDRNPLLGRSVAFIVRLFADNHVVGRKEWFDRMCNFLEKFGKEIWYLDISFQFVTGNWAKRMVFVFLTEKLFSLCPNLRKLGINELGSKLENAVDVAFDPQLLPEAPKLETLTTGLDNGMIFNTLLQRYRRQLRKIDAPEGIWRSLCLFDWSLLNELVLNYFNTDVINMFLGERSRMPDNLTKLGLIYWNEGKPIQMENFVEFINLVSATTRLNTLQLFGDQAPCPLQQITSYPFAHISASVKTVELVYYRYSANNVANFPLDSYDFLAHFAFVENVNIRFLNRKDVLRSGEECKMIGERLAGNREKVLEVIQYMFKGDMYKSNIWRMLQELKVFTFQWDVYTRDGYEAYLRGRAF